MKQRFALLAIVLTLALSDLSDVYAQWMQTGLTTHLVYCLAVSEKNLFAGTKNAGVFLSTNSGANWTSAGLPNNSVEAFAVNVTNGPLPMLFAGAIDSGVFLSTDSGIGWTRVNTGLTDTSVWTLAVSGKNLFAGTNSGVFRTSNNGTKWSLASNGLPDDKTIFSLAVVGTNIFAATVRGVFLSTDSGTNWNPVMNGSTSTTIYSLGVSGTNIFAGTYQGDFLLSSDSGTTWVPANTGLPKSIVYGFAAINTKSPPSMLFAGTDGNGVFFSKDKGISWTAANSALTDTNVGCLTVCGAYLVAGTDSGVWRRPLSDFGISAVSPVTSTENSLTSYPNPFSQSTTISFTTPESGVATVSVVNILGATVARIFSGELDAGTHTFTWDAGNLPAGMYECIVQMNGKVERTAMVVN